MKQLKKIRKFLPATIQELRDFILIGQEKLKAYQAKVRAIDKVGLAKNVRDRTLTDAQEVATAVLYAEAKLGELIKPLTQESITDPSSGRKLGSKLKLPNGISWKQSHYAQQIADHQDIIEEVIEEAKQKEEIPTRYEALKKIQQMKIDKQKAERQQNISEPFPESKYRTIVIDPPWPVEKILRQERQQHDSFDYPTMTLEEITRKEIAALKKLPKKHLRDIHNVKEVFEKSTVEEVKTRKELCQ